MWRLILIALPLAFSGARIAAQGEAEVTFGTQVYLPRGWTKAQYLPAGKSTHTVDVLIPSAPEFGEPTTLGTKMKSSRVTAAKTVIVPFHERISFLEYGEFTDELKLVRRLRENEVPGKDILAEVRQGDKSFSTLFALGETLTYANARYVISEIRELTEQERGESVGFDGFGTEDAGTGVAADGRPKMFVILKSEDGRTIPVPFNVNIFPRYYKLTFKDLKNGKLFYATYPGEIKVRDRNGRTIETFIVADLFEGGVVLEDKDKRKFRIPRAGDKK